MKAEPKIERLMARAMEHDSDNREIIMSLQLAITQIGMSMQESDGSIDELIAAITTVAESAKRIDAELKTHGQSGNGNSVESSIHPECEKAEQGMQQAIMAFQFYDRLSQRMLQIEENLNAIAEVIVAPEEDHLGLWRNLQSKMRSVYSPEQEQRMTLALLDSLSGKINVEQPTAPAKPSYDDIELF